MLEVGEPFSLNKPGKIQVNLWSNPGWLLQRIFLDILKISILIYADAGGQGGALPKLYKRHNFENLNLCGLEA